METPNIRELSDPREGRSCGEPGEPDWEEGDDMQIRALERRREPPFLQTLGPDKSPTSVVTASSMRQLF